jgi:hypothetical protein
MRKFDLAISFIWKFDQEFIQLLEKIFHKNNLSTFIISEHNLDETVYLLRNKLIQFSAYLDRASDENPRFLQITKILRRKNCWLINDPKIITKAVDKAYMHKKLIKKKFTLPKTHILPAFDQDYGRQLTHQHIQKIGIPFVIKPAIFSGGAQGVVTDAVSLKQIQTERESSPTEPYLIQQKIEPKKIINKRAWFRVFWFFDHAYPVMWDDQSLLYRKIKEKELASENLLNLFKISKRLARITTLDYFSSEVALTRDHHFYLIDYVNDQCDFRLKSIHKDGVPDIIVREFILSLMNKIKNSYRLR